MVRQVVTATATAANADQVKPTNEQTTDAQTIRSTQTETKRDLLENHIHLL